MLKNKTHEQELKEKGIVLFDGFCNLCSSSVQFIIRRDSKDYFRFASLQSDEAQLLLKKFEIPNNFDKSVVLIEHHRIYTKSDAALRIAKKLRHFWPLSFGFIVIPGFIRNSVYDFIARNRFKWFGEKDTCYIPDKDMSYKFL